MGQCQLPSCSPGPELVCGPPTISGSVPSTLISVSSIKEFFSAWRCGGCVHMALLQAVAEECNDTDVSAVQDLIQHSRRFFPRCLAMEDTACDVDEVLWLDPARQQDGI